MRFLCSGRGQGMVSGCGSGKYDPENHTGYCLFHHACGSRNMHLAFHGGRLFHFRGLTRNIKHLKDIMERTGAGNLELRYQGRSRDEVDYLGNL